MMTVIFILGSAALIIVVGFVGLILSAIKKPIATLAILAIFTACLYGMYKHALNRHHLNLLPAQLQVSKTLYVKEESWGIGMPGDNETGLITYELPEEQAQKMMRQGLEYFANVHDSFGHEVNGWEETPIKLGDAWQGPRYNSEEPVSNIDTLSIENYLDRYGFGIPIDGDVKEMIDQAITKPGSYYAYGNGGLIVIVIPKDRKVISAYAG
ncbi:MAG TPA: hypothetical protein PL131_07160 [Methylotenera sp.]|mgnify:CR=1 FL=1|nr:hypothetical protein [Methylotenera sp.]HPH05638.1 hypothetical protein [Methylotenera sp.]HPN01935.1 hypothetical protein [Methylotenera sp.]